MMFFFQTPTPEKTHKHTSIHIFHTPVCHSMRERRKKLLIIIIIYVCIKTLTLKRKSIITPENVSLVKFKYLRNGESLTTRADKFDFLRATGRLAFEPNLVESVGRIPDTLGRIPGKVVAFPTHIHSFHVTNIPVVIIPNIYEIRSKQRNGKNILCCIREIRGVIIKFSRTGSPIRNLITRIRTGYDSIFHPIRARRKMHHARMRGRFTIKLHAVYIRRSQTQILEPNVRIPFGRRRRSRFRDQRVIFSSFVVVRK